MDDLELFRLRLALAGTELPAELVPMVQLMFGPLLGAVQALSGESMPGVVPFVPGERLAADAVR